MEWEEVKVGDKVEDKEEAIFRIRNYNINHLERKEECTKISYSLLPTEKGETTIYFKIKSANTNEEFEQKIRVD